MNDTANFDVLAKDYDHSFSNSLTGHQQRTMSRKWLMHFLQGRVRLKILEINCGTGEDAIWLASLGHDVIATDISPAMIEACQQKLEFSNRRQPFFSVCGFDQLDEMFQSESFDLVFSNFAGLNCLDPFKLEQLLVTLNRIIKPAGNLAVVIFGRFCLSEIFYYLVKLKPRHAFRRWSPGPVVVPLKKGTVQPVYYHPVKKLMSGNYFSLVTKRPIGFLIPPSYMEALVVKFKNVFNMLSRMEKKTGFSWNASLADHTYILLKKQA